MKSNVAGCPAVLLIAFNRPDLAARCLSAISLARPSRLYVAVDGPRPHFADDIDLVKLTQQVLTDSVDWPCDVQFRFRETNLGCRRGVVDAVDWFFESEDEGIILEDDCVAHPDFFAFCSDLLHRYRDHHRILSIGGDNSGEVQFRGPWSYGFVRHPAIWGWATWKRAWSLYDRDMKMWQSIRETPLVEMMFPEEEEKQHRASIFDRTLRGEIDTWDYQWSATCHAYDALTVMPVRNLVSNHGFRSDATHTRRQSGLAAARTAPLFPLTHPPVQLIDRSAELQVLHKVDFSGQRASTRVPSTLIAEALRRTKVRLGRKQT
jgi:hypothetical protein